MANARPDQGWRRLDEITKPPRMQATEQIVFWSDQGLSPGLAWEALTGTRESGIWWREVHSFIVGWLTAKREPAA